MDTGFDPRVDPPHAVKLFSVVELLPAHGGATMVIAGSHALQSEYAASRSADRRAGNSQTWGRFLRGADPWLARLIDANDDGVDRNERFARPTQIRGHAVEVRELTGEPGDVHVTHINLFHSASPNAGNRPRVAVTHVVTRSTVDG
jgi:ectoine hydroxylase-related dioxygenase (phytanoyl-CoA dioxygenase family)